MTTRDPRSRAPRPPDSGREPTQSLSIEIDAELEAEVSHPSLAVGTSDSPRTKVELPAGRNNAPKPGTRPPPLPGEAEYKIGAVLGTYRLAELLGKGGMGYVYRAEHVKLGREVALKLLRGDYARRREAVLRFFQEAKTVNRVRHRNIVDVTDFVELDDGTTFIIMELLRGQSLGKWARTGIDLPRALAVLVQICDGLGAAHAVGVVHRDLKPDNVIVVPTADGAELVKLLDFGVAKLVNRDDEDVGFQTAAGSVIGTPAYMSPEQAGGMLLDHRSDIYSLGAIMYELFTGQPMFRGRSFGEFVRKHLTELPVPPRQTQGGGHIGEKLEAIILKCLAKDPDERYATIVELRDGILAMLGSIDTLPPSYTTVGQSSIPVVRPPKTAQLARTLPLPAPAMTTTVPTPPAESVTQSAAHSSLSHTEYVESTPPASTSLGGWLIGGAIAIAGGVAGALWYAGRASEPTPVAAETAPQAPTTAPLSTPATVPQLVDLRFDSLPAAGVYAAGHAAELCHTPCSYTFNLTEGDRRKFVIRTAGYQDARIDVDLRGTQRDFSVTLEHLGAGAASSASEASIKRQSHPSGSHGTKHTPDKKPDDSEPENTNTQPDSTNPQPDNTNTEPEKPEKPAAPATPVDPGGKIDPTDTHNPFRR
jgi:serine/threonine protein kinase